MDLATYQREAARHRQVYDACRDQISRDLAGKYIVLANGQLLAATPTYDEARAVVEQIEPAPEFFLIFPADLEPAFELAYDF